jgi:hypothetical protein
LLSLCHKLDRRVILRFVAKLKNKAGIVGLTLDEDAVDSFEATGGDGYDWDYFVKFRGSLFALPIVGNMIRRHCWRILSHDPPSGSKKQWIGHGPRTTA